MKDKLPLGKNGRVTRVAFLSQNYLCRTKLDNYTRCTNAKRFSWRAFPTCSECYTRDCYLQGDAFPFDRLQAKSGSHVKIPLRSIRARRMHARNAYTGLFPIWWAVNSREWVLSVPRCLRTLQ